VGDHRGQHHCAAIDREGVVYTWGNGGYGRLGHKDQQDQWTPKSLRDSCVRAREVSCGSAHCTARAVERTGIPLKVCTVQISNCPQAQYEAYERRVTGRSYRSR
jgi:alpha-tubulin suppressor-like RCC1 family protein